MGIQDMHDQWDDTVADINKAVYAKAVKSGMNKSNLS